MNERRKLRENAGIMSETPEEDAKEQWIIKNNIEKIAKTLRGIAHAMDKQDRPSAEKTDKANASVYINFVLSEIIEELQADGYDVTFKEEGR